MSPDYRRTLLIDAVIVAVLVVLAFVLAPGVAIVGIAALLVLFLGAISFTFSGLRARRRRRQLAARRRTLAGGQPAYGVSRVAAGRPERPGDSPREEPTVRRVPASRRAQTRRTPPP